MKSTDDGSQSSRTWTRIKRRIFPRGLKFTREGKVYTTVTLGVGFAAVNTGNNLLFLVLGLMLGLIIVSGILSEMSLRGLEVCRRVEPRAEARIPFPVELALKNLKRRVASYGVELRDEIDGKPFRRRCFFLRVGAGEERAIAYRCEIDRRGHAHFEGTTISTRFPFGLFEKRRYISLSDRIIVLPARLKIGIPPPFFALGDGSHSASQIGPGQEFRELKEMVPGDDPRRIHWRSTARLGRPMVRETDVDAAGFLELVLDPAPEDQNARALEQVERNIEAAGTIIRALTSRGLMVRLVTSPPAILEAGTWGDAVGLLEHLALLEAEQASVAAAPVGASATSVLIGPRAQGRGRTMRFQVPAPAPEKNHTERR